VAFPPGGDTLITASGDGTVRIWDLVIQEERLTLRDHTDIIHDLALAPDGATLATAGRDGTVRLWHAPRDKK
jgi:WD40 repeat protein